MNPSRIIALSANLETIIDERLFRERQPGESVDDHKTVKGAVLVGAGVAGASAAAGAVKKYANSAGVTDRMAGLRSTVPGFAQKSPGAQRAQATVSRAGSDIASGVKSARKTVAKEAVYRGQGVLNAADSAVRGGLRKTAPLITRVGALARKLAKVK